MTIANAIPELWLARALDYYYRETIWGALLTDLSNETPIGNKLHMNQISGTITMRDYTREQVLAAPQYPDTSVDTLDLNQQKYFNIAVDDIDAAQTRLSLLEGHSRNAGRAMAREVDNYLRTQIDSEATVKATVTSGIIDNLGVPGSTNALPDLIETFLTDFIWEASSKDWPKGRERWCVGCPTLTLRFQEWMIGNSAPGTGKLGDEQITDEDISNVFGITYRTDREMDVPSSDDDPIAYIGTKEAAAYAIQIRKIEPYRPDDRFGDAIKGLYVYGMDVMHSTNLIKMEVTV